MCLAVTVTACKDAYDDVDNVEACQLGCANQPSDTHVFDDVSTTNYSSLKFLDTNFYELSHFSLYVPDSVVRPLGVARLPLILPSWCQSWYSQARAHHYKQSLSVMDVLQLFIYQAEIAYPVLYVHSVYSNMVDVLLLFIYQAEIAYPVLYVHSVYSNMVDVLQLFIYQAEIAYPVLYVHSVYSNMVDVLQLFIYQAEIVYPVLYVHSVYSNMMDVLQLFIYQAEIAYPVLYVHSVYSNMVDVLQLFIY